MQFESISDEIQCQDVQNVLKLFDSLPTDILIQFKDAESSHLDSWKGEENSSDTDTIKDVETVPNGGEEAYRIVKGESDLIHTLWNGIVVRFHEEQSLNDKNHEEIRSRLISAASEVWNTSESFIPSIENFLRSKISRFVHIMRVDLSQRAIAASGLPYSESESVWGLLNPKKIRELIEIHESSLNAHIPYFMGTCYRELAFRLKDIIEIATDLAKKDLFYDAWSVCASGFKLSKSHAGSGFGSWSSCGFGFKSSCTEEVEDLRLLNERIQKSESSCLSAQNSLFFSFFAGPYELGKPVYVYISAKNKLGTKLKSGSDLSRISLSIASDQKPRNFVVLHLGNGIYSAIWSHTCVGTHQIFALGTEGFSEVYKNVRGSPLNIIIPDQEVWTLSPITTAHNMKQDCAALSILGLGKQVFVQLVGQEETIQFMQLTKEGTSTCNLSSLDFELPIYTATKYSIPILLNWRDTNVLCVIQEPNPEASELTSSCIKCQMFILSTSPPSSCAIMWTKYFRNKVLHGKAFPTTRFDFFNFSRLAVVNIKDDSGETAADIMLPIRYVPSLESWKVCGLTLWKEKKAYIFGLETDADVLVLGSVMPHTSKLPVSDDLLELDDDSILLDYQSCGGNVPCSRSNAAVSINGNFLVVYGGVDENGCKLDDLYTMNLESFRWCCVYCGQYSFDSEIELQNAQFAIWGDQVISYTYGSSSIKQYKYSMDIEEINGSDSLKSLLKEIRNFCDETRAELRLKIWYGSKKSVFKALNRSQIDHKIEQAIEIADVLQSLNAPENKELKADLVAVRNSVIQLNNLAMDVKAKILVSNPPIENIVLQNIRARLAVMDIDRGSYFCWETGYQESMMMIEDELGVLSKLEEDLMIEASLELFFGNDKIAVPLQMKLFAARKRLSKFRALWDVVNELKILSSCPLYEAVFLEKAKFDLLASKVETHNLQDSEEESSTLVNNVLAMLKNFELCLERLKELNIVNVSLQFTLIFAF